MTATRATARLPFVAFYRPAWRLAILPWVVFALAMAAGLVTNESLSSAVASTQGGSAELDQTRTATRLWFVLPVVAGFLAGRVTRELQHRLFSWTLPGLRKSLFLSVLPLAVLTPLPFALAAHDGVAFFALYSTGLLWFWLATAPFDAYPTPWLSWLALAVLVAAFARAGRLLAFVVTHPASAFMALMVSALLAWREYSRGAARARPFHTAFPLGLTGEGEWWTERLARPGRAREWSGASPGASRGGWMRAALYENFGRYRFGWAGWAIGLAFAAAGFVVVAGVRAEDVFSVYAMAVYIHHLIASSFLSPRALYPLSREKRARVSFWTSVVDSAAFTGILVLAMAVVSQAAGLLTLREPAVSLSEALVTMLVLWVWVPVLQWVQLRYLRREGSAARSNILGYARFFAWLIAFLALAKLSAWFVAGETDLPLNVPARIVTLLGAAILVRILYRSAIYRYFQYDDLV
jgi:hypothetical protein